ncbi:YGR125W [Symbiodinium microadriaticum]|nr:YGR125W [Symbiodinium microadriaticum]
MAASYWQAFCQEDLFPDMEAAIFYVEDLALQYAKAMEGLFSSLHPAIQYHQAVRKEQVTFEPFGGILVTDDARLGCPWRFCTKVDITKHSTLLWSSNDKHDVLYLIHTGSVGIFESIPEDRRHWKSPAAVYGHGQFLNLATWAA